MQSGVTLSRNISPTLGPNLEGCGGEVRWKGDTGDHATATGAGLVGGGPPRPSRPVGGGWQDARRGMEGRRDRRGGREGGGDPPYHPNRSPRCTPTTLRAFSLSYSSPTPERPLNPIAQARVSPPTPSPRGWTDGASRHLPSRPVLPIPRCAGGGEAREPGGARRGHGALGTTLMILPQFVQFISVAPSCLTL